MSSAPSPSSFIPIFPFPPPLSAINSTRLLPCFLPNKYDVSFPWHPSNTCQFTGARNYFYRIKTKIPRTDLYVCYKQKKKKTHQAAPKDIFVPQAQTRRIPSKFDAAKKQSKTTNLPAASAAHIVFGPTSPRLLCTAAARWKIQKQLSGVQFNTKIGPGYSLPSKFLGRRIGIVYVHRKALDKNKVQEGGRRGRKRREREKGAERGELLAVLPSHFVLPSFLLSMCLRARIRLCLFLLLLLLLSWLLLLLLGLGLGLLRDPMHIYIFDFSLAKTSRAREICSAIIEASEAFFACGLWLMYIRLFILRYFYIADWVWWIFYCEEIRCWWLGFKEMIF